METDLSIRDVKKVEDTTSIQRRTLEVLSSIEMMLKRTGIQPTSIKSSRSSSKKESIDFSSASSFNVTGRGETLGSYLASNFKQRIDKFTQPLESFLGFDLKKITGLLINKITHVSSEEKSLLKSQREREKQKLESLKEEMRLGKKALSSIDVDWKSTRLRDKEGKFISEKDMTPYERIKYLQGQFGKEISEKNKSKYQREIEKILGKSPSSKSNIGFRSRKESFVEDLSPTSPLDQIGFDMGGEGIVKPKINPTIMDLSKTAPGQSMLWYYNQLKGKKSKGLDDNFGFGDILGSILTGNLLSKLVSLAVPAIIAALPTILPVAIPLILGGAGLVALVVDSVENKKKEEKKDKELMESIEKKYPNLSEKEKTKKFWGTRSSSTYQLGIKIKDGEYYDYNSGMLSVYKDNEIIDQKYVPLQDIEPRIKSGKVKTQMEQESVKDAIITKSGKVIHTSPDDTIFATKNQVNYGKDVQGFDSKNISILLNKLVQKPEKDNEIVDAVKELTDVMKKKDFNNIVTGYDNSSNIDFNQIRMSMSYNKGRI